MAEIHPYDIILGCEVDAAGKVSGNKIIQLEKRFAPNEMNWQQVSEVF